MTYVLCPIDFTQKQASAFPLASRDSVGVLCQDSEKSPQFLFSSLVVSNASPIPIHVTSAIKIHKIPLDCFIKPVRDEENVVCLAVCALVGIWDRIIPAAPAGVALHVTGS